MKLTLAHSDFTVPEGIPAEEALRRTTHLGIGAHQDDLEFMALHGILECYQREDRWFGGITCTNGAGSARTGPFADFSDEQMRAVRTEEQKAAARMGQYAFIAQLGYRSSDVKGRQTMDPLIDDLVRLLEVACPQFIYTHNPFDRHPTHRGVLVAVLEAIARLSNDTRPKALYGCEVWRGLEWLPAPFKVAHDVSAHPQLAADLNACFASQIAGGKRYDLAIEGRRRANATFHDAHSVDAATGLSYAIDLSCLLAPDGPKLGDFVSEVLEAFNGEVGTGLAACLRDPAS